MDNPKADFFRPKISTFRYYKSEKSGKVIKKFTLVYKTKALKYNVLDAIKAIKTTKYMYCNIQEQVIKITRTLEVHSEVGQIKRGKNTHQGEVRFLKS